MNINEMTIKQFRELPDRKWDEETICSSLIILPGLGAKRELHDSGYRCMGFVAVKGQEPICLLSGCSDVVHIDGISGFGENWLEKYGKCPNLIPPSGWSIDCLPTSGLLRIWPSSQRIKCGHALSSFEIFALDREKEKDNVKKGRD